MTDEANSRSRVPFLIFLIGALLAVIALAGVLGVGEGGSSSGAAQAPVPTALDKMIDDAQESLRRHPGNAMLWAQLGAGYVEQARITGDPSYYGRSQGALDRSLQVAPDGNGEALVGLGQLANARHDFAAAKNFGEQARALRPFSPEVYGVLADAYTQLGDAPAASAAVQKMLDVRPGLAAFTRASYDLELHGRNDDARAAMERALGVAVSADDVAFCRYYLGELGWNAGRVDEAAEQYARGLDAAPRSVALLQGRAKVAYAQGRVDEALAGYRDVTTRVPLPQYLLEYGELLAAAGHADEAAAQYEVLTVQRKLYAAQGSNDDQFAALVTADHGDAVEALRLAQAEWARRQSVFSADSMAWALHATGRDREALGYAERAAALGGRNATYSYHRGVILAALGRNGDALVTLKDAVAVNPHFNPLQAPAAAKMINELQAGA